MDSQARLVTGALGFDSIMTELARFEVSLIADGASDRATSGRRRILLSVFGQVDIGTSPQLEQELDGLLGAGPVGVIIDMAAVDFIDASGIGVLADAADRARRAGGEMVLSRPSPRVYRVLDVLQLDGALPVIPDPVASD